MTRIILFTLAVGLLAMPTAWGFPWNLPFVVVGSFCITRQFFGAIARGGA